MTKMAFLELLEYQKLILRKIEWRKNAFKNFHTVYLKKNSVKSNDYN